MQRSAVGDGRALATIGISDREEHVYRALLLRPSASVGDLADVLVLAPQVVQRALDIIESKGLATHTPDRPRRYLAASPNIALEALVLEGESKLQRVRATVEELQELASAAQPDSSREPTVELITSRESGRQLLEQMDRSAEHEMINLIRKPILIMQLGGDEAQFTQQQDARRRGVSYRSIVDADYLALEGAVRRTWNDMASGEIIRVYPHLPFKMAMVDQRMAFIPLNLKSAGGPSLLLRSSALLDALHALFEMLWQRSAPIAFDTDGAMQSASIEAPSAAAGGPGVGDLLSLLAAGLNDKAIAHELGLSDRTLARRVGELLKDLDARTRFQAGWAAAMQQRQT